MDNQLDYAPGGYFSISEAGFVQSVNRTFLDMLSIANAEDLIGKHIETVMSPTNKMFFHTYFYPHIQLYERVDEMYFSFRSTDKQSVPVLINGIRQKRGGEMLIDCVALLMRKRLEYEKDTLRSKQQLEELYQATSALNSRLESLHEEYERKQQALLEINRNLETLASTDPLTGLHNRRFFQDCLRGELLAAKDHKAPLSLLIIDIDHFKNINDTYGHPVGDFVLIELARLLRKTAGSRSICARFGGEEFVVLLPTLHSAEALKVAEQIRSAIEQTPLGLHQVTVSIGAETSLSDSTEETLIERADLALYHAKSSGRNRVVHAEQLAHS
ncbi:sensor domain-containing diguanylate cyclase [Saccharibacillus sp. JS10]|uniref:sensor domain-containing diguanylate cyclase n=1 Tax=Saccharibacillus sp. JS10 TaxID=2950552 RepID=UPI00210B5CF5|nr:sensor domain-containing diguanylate cyclase [Saccharibacillus sp. JS10]MCQ4088298.1 sensor domain-containing diguanylate cyclase [Saccharibacillus sp. JS10]